MEYARTNVIGSRSSFVIASVRSSKRILLIKQFVVAFVRCTIVRCSIRILLIKQFVVAFVRCSIRILLIKQFVRCSIRILLIKQFVVAFVRCSIVRCSIPYCISIVQHFVYGCTFLFAFWRRNWKAVGATEWDVRQNNATETESREQAEKLHIKG